MLILKMKMKIVQCHKLLSQMEIAQSKLNFMMKDRTPIIVIFE